MGNASRAIIGLLWDRDVEGREWPEVQHGVPPGALGSLVFWIQLPQVREPACAAPLRTDLTAPYATDEPLVAR